MSALSCRAELAGEARDFCCTGCLAVAQTIHATGLEGFYRHRRELGKPLEDADGQAALARAVYDQPALRKRYVRAVGDGLDEVTLTIANLRCAACVWLCEQHLAQQRGVMVAHVNYSTGRARVRWDGRLTGLSAILAALAAIGYQAEPFDVSRDAGIARRERRGLLLRMAVAMLGMMQVMMYAWPAYLYESVIGADYLALLRWASLALTLPVVFYSACPLIAGAWRSLRNRHLGMDVPVAIGIGAAFAASVHATITGRGEVYFDSVTMFVALLLAARYLELCARQDARSGAAALAAQVPAIGSRLPGYPLDRRVVMVALAEVSPGDVLRVRPGDAIPADGVIVEGETDVDEAMLTGESRPLRRTAGEQILAGSYNCTSPILVRVAKVGEQTRMAEIVQVLDRALEQKPRVAVVADRIATWFVGALILLALATGAVWWGIDATRALPIMVAVLVVSCPCALSLATPAALAAATGGLARRGVLIVHGHALETLSRVTDIVFDKTGTLTEGKFALLSVDLLGALPAADCLALAALLEAPCNHPIAKALVLAAAAHKADESSPVPPRAIRYVPGQGLEAAWSGSTLRLGSRQFVQALAGPSDDTDLGSRASASDTEVWLGSGNGLLARFVLGDRLRDDASSLVEALRHSGFRLHLVSGDDTSTVRHWAGLLGMEHALGNVSPEGKKDYVARLQSAGAVVLAVGDGINDAPVLALAQVSMAIGRGTPLARASADAVLMGDGVMGVAHALSVARRTRHVIGQNLGWALAYNLVFIPLAACGLISAWMAGAGMSLSSLLVVGNAWRLRR